MNSITAIGVNNCTISFKARHAMPADHKIKMEITPGNMADNHLFGPPKMIAMADRLKINFVMGNNRCNQLSPAVYRPRVIIYNDYSRTALARGVREIKRFGKPLTINQARKAVTILSSRLSVMTVIITALNRSFPVANK